MSKPLLERFILAETKDVFHWFASLPRAIRGNKYVYIPGTLDKKVLLVAHADTVFTWPPHSVEWYGNIARANPYKPAATKDDKGKTTWGSSYRFSGLGADDRAGCALMWTFRNSGHSILITDEEEKGCIGAGLAAEEIGLELADHLFAVEVDRRGDMNYVYYNVASAEFDAWLTPLLPNWEEQVGSFSDIAEICGQVGISGVNLAAGYIDEHSQDETFFLDAWWRTRASVERILNAADARFPLPEAVRGGRGARGGTRYFIGYDPWDEAGDSHYDEWTAWDARRKDGCAHTSWSASKFQGGLECCNMCFAYRLNSDAYVCDHVWMVYEPSVGLSCELCDLTHQNWLKYDGPEGEVGEDEDEIEDLEIISIYEEGDFVFEDEDEVSGTSDDVPSWQTEFENANTAALRLMSGESN